MVLIVFTTTCAISAYHPIICEFEPRSWQGVLDTTLCDKVQVVRDFRQVGGFLHRGSQLYFHITRYVLKEEGMTLFLLPKVKVEFRHLFLLQKRFSPQALVSFKKYMPSPLPNLA